MLHFIMPSILGVQPVETLKNGYYKPMMTMLLLLLMMIIDETRVFVYSGPLVLHKNYHGF